MFVVEYAVGSQEGSEDLKDLPQSRQIAGEGQMNFPQSAPDRQRLRARSLCCADLPSRLKSHVESFPEAVFLNSQGFRSRHGRA